MSLSLWICTVGVILPITKVTTVSGNCCCCSVAKSCPTLCDPMDSSMPGFLLFTISQSLLKFMSIESVMPSNHLILCCPLHLLPAIFPSIRIFSNEPALCTRWPKYWSFSFSISPSSEYSGLISFRIDWLDLLSVQGMLKNCGAKHHSSKASILALTLLYDSTVTSVHNFWKKHSLDYMDLC